MSWQAKLLFLFYFILTIGTFGLFLLLYSAPPALAAEFASASSILFASSTSDTLVPDISASSTLSEPSSIARQLISEPLIVVSLYEAKDAVDFVSPFLYQIHSGELWLGNLEPNVPAILSYKQGKYYFNSANNNFVSDEYFYLAPVDMEHYFTLTNYNRRLPRRWKNVNFNFYRGALALKYSERKNKIYAVNELPLNLYVAGIAETIDAAAPEYIKAILVAARSYGYYQINNGMPRSKRLFDVYASTVDQLYLGYNSEISMPRVALAASTTYGEMVTYLGAPVITPYFANSNGYTRSWQTVWRGSDKPWLQKVEAVYDKGRKFYGHGVGISMRDASFRASKDSWDYKRILKYYYSGTEVERVY